MKTKFQRLSVVKNFFHITEASSVEEMPHFFRFFSLLRDDSSPDCRSNIWRPKRLKNDLVIKKTYPLSCHARHANLSNRGSFSRCIVTLGKKRLVTNKTFGFFSRFFSTWEAVTPQKNECTRLRFVWWWNSHCHGWQNPPPQAFRDDSKSGRTPCRRASSS